jgi:L-ascorbate metabolism protein UlaG (beta-lactamase superfamily)
MVKLNLGNFSIEWLGHASFKISTKEKIIYIDPYILPKDLEAADLILVTHGHYDHCDVTNIKKLLKANTMLIATEDCRGALKGMKFKEVKPGESIEEGKIKIETVAAYNINKFRSPNTPFHPKGEMVGYVITVSGKRIYHAGDTDATPEMKNLKDIDVALLPIGGTYTMTVEEAAEAINTFKPKIVIPMHYNAFEAIKTDPRKLVKLVKGSEVKILK